MFGVPLTVKAKLIWMHRMVHKDSFSGGRDREYVLKNQFQTLSTLK